jgi:hypothetical protein
MTKFYRRLTLAAVIASVGSSAEAGMISRAFDVLRHPFGGNSASDVVVAPTPSVGPLAAVAKPDMIAMDLGDVAARNPDCTIEGRGAIGVRLTSAVSPGESDGHVAALKGGGPDVRTVHDDMTDGRAGIGTGDERTKKFGGTAGSVEGYNGGVGIGLRAQNNVGLGGHISMRADRPAIVPAGAKTPPPPVWVAEHLEQNPGQAVVQHRSKVLEDGGLEPWVKYQLPNRLEGDGAVWDGCIPGRLVSAVETCAREKVENLNVFLLARPSDDNLTNSISEGGGDGAIEPSLNLYILIEDCTVSIPCEGNIAGYCNTEPHLYDHERIEFTYHPQESRLELSVRTAEILGLPSSIGTSFLYLDDQYRNWYRWYMQIPVELCGPGAYACGLTVTARVKQIQDESYELKSVTLEGGRGTLISPCGMMRGCLNDNGGVAPGYDLQCRWPPPCYNEGRGNRHVQNAYQGDIC